MTTALMPVQTHDLAILTPLLDAAQTYADNAQAAATRRAYRADWSDFAHFCHTHHVAALPAAPATVALYLVDLINRASVATLSRRLSAISHAHRLAKLDIPTRSAEVHTILKGIKRTHGTAQQGKAAAVTEDVKLMVSRLPRDLGGVRDRALLLVGFAGALRRAELVAFDVADVQFKRDGLVLHIRRSKTDQEGKGATIGIAYGQDKASCPVRALKSWLAAAGITGGPIFRPVDRHNHLGLGRLRSDSVGRIVKRCAEAAGLNPTIYSGHSLRVGLVTSAARAGVSDQEIMDQTRHKDVRMVRRYRRESNILNERNVTRHVGL